MNYFDLFNFSVKFTIDLDELEEKYFAFQQRFHPDKARIEDIENSITINEAYNILKDDLARAVYVLQLSGINLNEDKKDLKPDMATLEEILDLQEKIPQFSDNEILTLKKDLKSQIKSLINEATLSYETKKLADAAQFLIKAKYLDKILRDLRK